MGVMASARWKCCFQGIMLIASCIWVAMVEAQEEQQQQQQQQVTNAEDLRVVHEMMYSMSHEYDWKSLFPDPCVSGPQGIVCTPDPTTGVLFVTELQFGFLSDLDNIISCSSNATIPSSIANLTHLTTLSITSCFSASNQTAVLPDILPSSLTLLSFTLNPGLVGSIPGSFGSLPALERLILSQNSLQGQIPGELGSLQSLIQLDLSHNNLSGPVPSTLTSLAHLVNLDLRYNSLSDSFPDLKLPVLERLAVSKNRISALPGDFTGLSSVTFMDFGWNELAGALPPSLGELTSLQDLYLNSNRLEGQIPGEELGSLTSLVRLDLSENELDGSIPEGFQELKNLRFLSVSDNRLSGEVPESLASLPVIFTLNLDGNELSGVLPFPPTFVKRMGRNLVVKGNPGLCYASEVPIDGLNPCPSVVMVAKSPSPLPTTPNTAAAGSSSSLKVLQVFVIFTWCWALLL